MQSGFLLPDLRILKLGLSCNSESPMMKGSLLQHHEEHWNQDHDVDR